MEDLGRVVHAWPGLLMRLVTVTSMRGELEHDEDGVHESFGGCLCCRESRAWLLLMVGGGALRVMIGGEMA